MRKLKALLRGWSPHPSPPPQGGREPDEAAALLPSPSWGGVGGGGVTSIAPAFSSQTLGQYARRSALDRLIRQGRYGADRPGGPGVILSLRHPASIVSVIARKGKALELSHSVQTHFGFDCPPPGRSSANGRMAVHWCGHEQWYAVAEGVPEGALYEELRRKLAGLASLSDQSHGRVILRIAGPRVRDLLAKGTPVDLHPRAFGPGRSAVTQMAHVGVHLVQVGPDAFELSVARGFAESFWEWLTEMAAEYGYEVR